MFTEQKIYIKTKNVQWQNKKNVLLDKKMYIDRR